MSEPEPPTLAPRHPRPARQCATENIDHTGYLLRLAELELLERERRTIERRIRQARFPAVKSLDGFDFAAIPSLNKMLVLELARCAYVERRGDGVAPRAGGPRQKDGAPRARPPARPKGPPGGLLPP